MNRRKFLKQTVSVVPLIYSFSPIAMAQRSILQTLLLNKSYKNRVLVLIQLNGGNDGLNTFIPLDKYDILSEARKNILIPENKILKLNDTTVVGLHPSMERLQKLYNDKLITVIQGVGYPNPDFSHFHGIDIKYTANIDKLCGKSGWIGRYLDHEYPNYPKGYPTQSTDGPPSIRLGMVSPKIVQGSEEDLSVGFTNINDFNFAASASNNVVPTNDLAGMNINTIMAISKQIEVYAPIIQTYAKRQDTLSKLYPEPEKNILADQLKMVAKLIGSGMNTRVYIVNQSGYDTHGDQVDKSDTTSGKHASLLANLSDAIAAFQDDINLMGKQDDVIGMTFSEFGRRIASTDSYGTDHGTAESVILFGSNVKNGIIGQNPELPKTVSKDDNLPMQYDFRSLYASVLTGWFGVSEDMVGNVIPQGAKERLNLFKTM